VVNAAQCAVTPKIMLHWSFITLTQARSIINWT
jgi:hypothetical protein